MTTTPPPATALGAPVADGLLLRPFRAADGPALIEVYRDPVLRHFSQVPVTDLDEAARWLDAQERGRADGTRYSFAVLDTATEAASLVGNVVLKRAEPGAPVAEVGYWTAAAARGRGVASRALEALTGWAFDTFAADGLVRLELLHQVDNEASCRVAEKTGYRFDALLPAFPPFPLDGHRHIRLADDHLPDRLADIP
ncbi:GNAT family N-acetyltransferase [Kitasatospora sp. NPDC093806]|uniref:GNAT family N-acetyltransferase n=1 Tax=Kitasatospora sp. NPDC093806 TaxID=3155075 RepID=UPI00342E951A